LSVRERRHLRAKAKVQRRKERRAQAEDGSKGDTGAQQQGVVSAPGTGKRAQKKQKKQQQVEGSRGEKKPQQKEGGEQQQRKRQVRIWFCLFA